MRFIFDEGALDCDDLDLSTVQESFRRLIALLSEMRDAYSERIGVVSGWGALPCWRGSDVATVLSTHAVLERDESLLLLGYLDKCTAIDDLAEDVDPDITVGESAATSSYGIGLAFDGLAPPSPQSRAVITLAHAGPSGSCDVALSGQPDMKRVVTFVTDFDDLRLYWRTVCQIENVPETRFFKIAQYAFPGLRFHPDLTFSKFRGGYSVRDEVIWHLSCLNDKWTEAYEGEAGNAEAISTRIGIDVSRESNKTRASDKLMKERDVEFDGSWYRCEWHSKLQPHQNRIHFHPAGQGLDLPLVGIFCDHLPTEG